MNKFYNMRKIKEKKKEQPPYYIDIIIVEEIINPKLSKIFLYEKYTNSYEIFSVRLQISYPDTKFMYHLFFVNLMDMYTQ